MGLLNGFFSTWSHIFSRHGEIKTPTPDKWFGYGHQTVVRQYKICCMMIWKFDMERTRLNFKLLRVNHSLSVPSFWRVKPIYFSLPDSFTAVQCFLPPAFCLLWTTVVIVKIYKWVKCSIKVKSWKASSCVKENKSTSFCFIESVRMMSFIQTKTFCLKGIFCYYLQLSLGTWWDRILV